MSKNRKKTTISVIMPVFNGARFLAEAIESILKQSFKDFELIIVNDASTDNSEKIIKSFLKKDKRIKLLNNKQNLGESASANVGFKAAQAKYIARMDQDDIAHPDRFAKQVYFLDHNPDHILVATQGHIIDENKQVVGHKLFPLDHETIYKEYGNFHPILHPSIMVRRSLLPDQKKLWTDQLSSADDYMTLFTLLMNGKFANLPEKLIYYRLHSNNNSMKNVRAKFINSLRVRYYAIRDLGYPVNIKMLILMLMQSAYILFLPEWLSIGTYLVLKGMKPFDLAFPFIARFKGSWKQLATTVS
ncbi:MAG: glycosyltransferase [Candidatus Woesebacteria bacterium]|jgi:glycosyltransferase involved in cell wall biosynthesis